MEAIYLEAEEKAMKHKWIIAVLLSLCITLITFEAFLSIFDPFGVVHYANDLHAFFAEAVTTSRNTDYALLPGRHLLSGWTLTVNDDGTRWVPDTNIEATRTIVFIGDSVTMGFGVNDYDTWVNLIAREFPDWQVINAGVAGFNSYNVRLTQARIKADVYIYYVVGNDDEPGANIGYAPRYWVFATYRYWWYATQSSPTPSAQDTVRFWEDIDTLAARGVYFVGSDDLILEVQVRYPEQSFVIDGWTSSVSRADHHASVEGNREIAAQVLKVVGEIVDQ